MLDPIACERAKNSRRGFQRICHIQREDGTGGLLEPTSTQDEQTEVCDEALWTYTVKYRQAKITTPSVLDVLRHVMYHPGSRGVIIAEKEKTAKEAFLRLANAWHHLPPPVRVPTVRDPSKEEILFDSWFGGRRHDGYINTITGGSRTPAIGHSPDYALITEYGEFENYDSFNGSFFPSVNKRPNAQVRIETTPGAYRSVAHQMFLKALNGEGRFTPLFLRWWADDTCTLPVPQGFRRTPEEEAYAVRVAANEAVALTQRWVRGRPAPVTDGHLVFRRIALDTEFHGDTRLFDGKYPPGPRDGWIVDGVPHIPQDALERLYAQFPTSVQEGEERVYAAREQGAPYLLTCDPAGFGQSGDPSAWTLWHGWDREEVACWSGRCDPGALADRLIRVRALYDADVIVESNKGECCQALLSRGCPKLVWDNGQPGWYATDLSKGQAKTQLVDLLRQREMTIHTTQTLDQLATWDGATRSNKLGHHWDRVVTCVIAAYGFRRMAYGHRPAAERPATPRRAGITWAELDASFPDEQKRGKVFGAR
jgi:hypothetical protein